MKTKDRILHIVAFCGCSAFIAILPIALLAIVVTYLMTSHVLFPSSVVIPLPGNRATLTYSHIGVHAFLPEYSRTVSLNGQKKHPLVIDTGHGTDVNLFWIENGDECFVRMQDMCGEHLLDVNADICYLMITVAPDSIFCAPLLTENPQVSVIRTVPGQSPATARVRVDKAHAVPLSDLVSDYTGEYMGVISVKGKLKHRNSYERPFRPIE